MTFAGDPLQSHIEDLVSHLGDPAYWAATTAEYGIGALSIGAPIEVAETPPASVDDSQVPVWLASKLDGTHAEFGTPDANTIYEIFYPSTTTVLLGSVPWCGGGFHDGVNVGATVVSYAVVADCTDPPSTASDAEFGDLDIAASHEVVEAVTDPCSDAGCTGYQLDFEHYVWGYLTGLLYGNPSNEPLFADEVADLCESYTDGFTVPGTLYNVQRIWSNVAMRGGHDPCSPRTTTTPYFNAMPVLPDDIDFAVTPQTSVRTKGIAIPVGQSRTVELDLYSDADTGGPFQVSTLLLSVGDRSISINAPSLRVHMDRSSGQNGEKLYLTISRLETTQVGTVAVVMSTLGSTITYWPFAVW